MREIEVPAYVRRLRIETRVCPVCGKTFEGTTRRRYCSTACERRAYYARHAVELKARRRERYQEHKTTPTSDAATE